MHAPTQLCVAMNQDLWFGKFVSYPSTFHVSTWPHLSEGDDRPRYLADDPSTWLLNSAKLGGRWVDVLDQRRIMPERFRVGSPSINLERLHMHAAVSKSSVLATYIVIILELSSHFWNPEPGLSPALHRRSFIELTVNAGAAG